MIFRRLSILLASGLTLGIAYESANAQRMATDRVSVTGTDEQGNGDSLSPRMSADGRFVVFVSYADNLVDSDGNWTGDVFVRDRLTGALECVSVNPSGVPGNGYSGEATISADGHFVAFWSYASDLVAGDLNGRPDVFVRDRLLGTTELVSVASSGEQGNDDSWKSSISADGRCVAFSSWASNFDLNDTNGVPDVYVRDRVAGTTERVSVSSTGDMGNDRSEGQAISADGNSVAFFSYASNLVSGDGNNSPDVFVHDRQAGTTERVSVSSAGVEGDSWSTEVSISADGRITSFSSWASNLVDSDTNGYVDVFVHDRQTGATERVSIGSDGSQGANGAYAVSGSMSGDGRFVTFHSGSDHFVAGDTNGCDDVYVRDRTNSTTTRVSVSSSGGQADAASDGAVISADGRFVAFSSSADNLVLGDTNAYRDVFVQGPYLTLEADPNPAGVGATLTFTTWTGEDDGVCALVISDVNGAPMFVPVVFANFDSSGRWVFSVTVPTGLSGNVFTLETVGFLPTGKVGLSNAVPVTFQ